MWAIIKNNIPGVIMITGTGALYGAMIGPYVDLILLAGVGAFCGGLAAVGLFGHPGRWGWGLAALGAIVATTLGAGLAGGLIAFPQGLWIAPAMVAQFPFEMFVAGPVWVALMAVTHLVMRHLRRHDPLRLGA